MANTENQEPRSRFLQQTLLPDEFVVRRGNFHWIYTFQACLKAGVWVALGFLGAFLFAQFGGGNMAEAEKSKPVFFLPLFGIILGGFIFVSVMLRKWTTEIVLTNRRFLYKTGVFSILVYKLNMQEINYCNITQSLVGNMLNYGRLFMFTHTLDDKNIYLPEIADPHIFSTEIETLKRMQY